MKNDPLTFAAQDETCELPQGRIDRPSRFPGDGDVSHSRQGILRARDVFVSRTIKTRIAAVRKRDRLGAFHQMTHAGKTYRIRIGGHLFWYLRFAPPGREIIAPLARFAA